MAKVQPSNLFVAARRPFLSSVQTKIYTNYVHQKELKMTQCGNKAHEMKNNFKIWSMSKKVWPPLF